MIPGEHCMFPYVPLPSHAVSVFCFVVGNGLSVGPGL